VPLATAVFETGFWHKASPPGTVIVSESDATFTCSQRPLANARGSMRSMPPPRTRQMKSAIIENLALGATSPGFL
jgi:hypothetical protein